MDNVSLRTIVLEKLARWKRLTLSDIETMLSPVYRPRLRLELFERLVQDGLITMAYVGDELVMTLVDAPGGASAPRE